MNPMEQVNDLVNKTKQMAQRSNQEEEELQEVANEIQEIIKEEKDEIKVNEDLLNHIKQIMSDYEDIEHRIQPLLQKMNQADDSNAAKLSVYLDWYSNHGREISSDVKDLHSEFSTLMDEEEREFELTQQIENEEGQVNEQIKEVLNEFHSNVEQADQAIDEASSALESMS